ncbi:hypothetical protein HBZS_107300 [Helicobacter bizzozeronii CCUG 35545]|nr:hypothetical protein HBZS_107300 [Helicobacter bizzozeronii CCUG 35545]
MNEIHPSAFIHPSSYLDDPISIQEGVKIWHFLPFARTYSYWGACEYGAKLRGWS